jgi:BRCA1-associated protein
LESIQLEYTYLLTSQLESQRHYFESKLAKAEEAARKDTAEVRERARRLSEENKVLASKLASSAAEKKNQEKRAQTLNAKVAKLSQELADEKQMNACLRADKVCIEIFLKTCYLFAVVKGVRE